MKESEAKKKLCPIGHGQKSIGAASMPVNTYCKGSECMMWESGEWQQKNPDPKGVPNMIIMNEGEGDCGLKTKELYCEGFNN